MEATQFTLQNSRSYQEDRSFIHIQKNGEVLLGVFDGHGGHWVSELAVNDTPKIFKSLKKTVKKDPELAIKQLFEKLVEKTNEYTSGSTAAVVWIKDNVAHVGILGDSRVIIGKVNGEHWISPEHNVRSNIIEAHAAEKLGGYVAANGYLFDRSQYQGEGLQMSRALGDRSLRNVLNREPEIFHIPLEKDGWILLCSDGLIGPSHIGDGLLGSIINQIKYFPTMTAEELVNFAAQFDRSDNSTAILARF
jgi:serine/threonine protein phosphatase PrpC